VKLSQERYEDLRAAHIARYLPGVNAVTIDRLRALPNVSTWLRGNVAIAYFGPVQMARNVQVTGLAEACGSWGIPFLSLSPLAPREIVQLTTYDEVVIFSYPSWLPILRALRDALAMRIVVFGAFYDAVPNPALGAPLPRDQKAVVGSHRHLVELVLSEFSPEGNARYFAGYTRDHGLPVMTFPWSANLMRHFPAEVSLDADAVFLGSYFEKPKRINAYFGDTIRRQSTTIVGPGWHESPFGLPSDQLEDFDRVAPELYSSHAACLNIHHDYQQDGYSCNERGFNTVACGGFQISDPSRRLRHYFPDDEVVMADPPADFTEKVRHFSANPADRQPYMQKAQARVFAEYTYHHRLADVLAYVFDGETLSEHQPIMGDPQTVAE
jgi:hypothetical protein